MPVLGQDGANRVATVAASRDVSGPPALAPRGGDVEGSPTFPKRGPHRLSPPARTHRSSRARAPESLALRQRRQALSHEIAAVRVEGYAAGVSPGRRDASEAAVSSLRREVADLHRRMGEEAAVVAARTEEPGGGGGGTTHTEQQAERVAKRRASGGEAGSIGVLPLPPSRS